MRHLASRLPHNAIPCSTSARIALTTAPTRFAIMSPYLSYAATLLYLTEWSAETVRHPTALAGDRQSVVGMYELTILASSHAISYAVSQQAAVQGSNVPVCQQRRADWHSECLQRKDEEQKKEQVKNFQSSSIRPKHTDLTTSCSEAVDGVYRLPPTVYRLSPLPAALQNTLHAVATERLGQNNCAPALASASSERLNFHLHMPEVWCVLREFGHTPLARGQIPIRSEMAYLPEPLSLSTVHPITDPSLFKRSTSLTSFTPNPGSQLADRWVICASGPPICINRAAAAHPPESDLEEDRQGDHHSTALVNGVPADLEVCQWNDELEIDPVRSAMPISHSLYQSGQLFGNLSPAPAFPCGDHGSDGASDAMIYYGLI
ncbi:hypothetical protein CORC01_10588 [Colletotrichum orchidophilum]|uniref:Uncharacterized protein n=1 Tax=Colletotrichum orchidophilum TaxID=1209926 RepID=A0A1G4AYC4_9PEZI|nr:uncharacterized protein CORC01_10588 [Colletotrichum orchidophilum]OHE94131.1 hypothetical protein CORC01_10588 [Colletotrichum orchidophilum]